MSEPWTGHGPDTVNINRTSVHSERDETLETLVFYPAHHVRDVGVAGSNPATPTKYTA